MSSSSPPAPSSSFQMKPSLLLCIVVLVSLSVVHGWPAYVMEDLVEGQWAPPGPGDMRGPCPGLNTLANHGYLPRNGMNISRSNLTAALEGIYNLSSVLANTLAFNGISIDGQDGMLALNWLSNHNTIEHDASMTRLDFYYGDNHDLNSALFQQLLASSSDGNVITEDDIAAYQSMRQNTSKSMNPDYNFGFAQGTLASGEAALLLGVFGTTDGTSYNVSLASVKTFFGLEQLPSDWTPSELGAIQLTELASTIKGKWNP